MSDLTKPVEHSTTTGMTGHGFYDANSEPQWNAIEAVLPWVEQAAQTLPSDTGPLHIADFGCSEGHNSIAVMQRAITALRRQNDAPVVTIHSDLPTNDFSKLFLNLQPGGKSVFDDPSVYSSVVAGSMYDQLLPPQSIDFAMTFNAIGFLSRKPIDQLPGYILPNGPSAIGKTGQVSEVDRAQFARQAQNDVATFLKARAAELRPGGKLLVQVFGCTDDARTCDGIYDVLNDAVLDHVQTGDIPRAIYDAYYQPVYFRHLAELTAPLMAPEFGLAETFTMVQAKSYEVNVPFNDAFAKTGDIQTYAQSYTNFFHAFTEAVLRHALPDTGNREELITSIYARAQERVAETPEKYPFRYAAIAMLLTRS